MSSVEDLDNKYIVIPPSGIAHLIPTFVQNRHADLLKLREAAESKDYETIKCINYKIKSVAKSYGFYYLDKLACEISRNYYCIDELNMSLDQFEDFLRNIQIIY